MCEIKENNKVREKDTIMTMLRPPVHTHMMSHHQVAVDDYG